MQDIQVEMMQVDMMQDIQADMMVVEEVGTMEVGQDIIVVVVEGLRTCLC